MRTDGVHLAHKEVTAPRADAGGFDQLTHYAAHDLVSDGELGSYLGALIRNASGAQLELLTPSIARTVAEMEDEAAKEAVSEVLETRLRGSAERQEPLADRALPAAIGQTAVGTPGRPAAPVPGEGVATGRVEWHTTLLAGVKVELRTYWEMLDAEHCCKPQRTLRTTLTDDEGEFRFEGVPTGRYTLRAVPPVDTYRPTEWETEVYGSYSERYTTLRVDKYLEVIGPDGKTGVGLMPTLAGDRFPVPPVMKSRCLTSSPGKMCRSTAGLG